MNKIIKIIIESFYFIFPLKLYANHNQLFSKKKINHGQPNIIFKSLIMFED